MKIVQVVTHMDTIGGAQIHVRDIAIGLVKSGHEVYLVAGGEKNIHGNVEKNKVKLVYSKYLIRNLNIVSDIKAVLEIRRIFKEIQPDLIATHSSKAGVVGRIAGWSLGIPTVFTAHGWSYTDGILESRRKFYIFIEKVIGRISHGVITVSDYDKQLALRHRVLPEEKIYLIHNGVHETKSLKNPKYSSGIPNIIMVARFATPKKQLQLLKVLNQIRDIPWKISFVGDGPLLQEAQDFVGRVGLGDKVSFLGSRQDVTQLLQRSNIFVLLSDWEGLPLSILEAMRCGLPIIASDVGGVNEAVIESENGYLIPKNDSNVLLNRLSFLLTNPLLRMEMGKNSRRLYVENFTYEKMFMKTLAYYKKITQTEQAVIQTN